MKVGNNDRMPKASHFSRPPGSIEESVLTMTSDISNCVWDRFSTVIGKATRNQDRRRFVAPFRARYILLSSHKSNPRTMIASRNLPQRAASTSLLMRADEKLTLSTPFGSCNRASSISLLEEDDKPTTVPEGEISATSPSRRRSTRRGLHRAASISVLQKDGKVSPGKTSGDNGDDETGPESPPRAVSRSLKRAASVSTLGKDANSPTRAAGATGGRTRTALVRTQSKRSLSRESSARRLGHLTHSQESCPST